MRPGEPVTLVVPVRDEAATVEALVATIHRQRRPPDEVVFVDGGSTDGTPSLLRRLTEGDPRFSVIEAGPGTPGSGRNVGIAAARHDWVALTDAGIELDDGWLESLLEAAHAHPEAEVVYGSYEPIVSSFFEECAAAVYVPPRRRVPGGEARGPSVASCLLRRRAWESVGGFPDLRASEDLIFLRRLDERGVTAVWAPRAVVAWRLQPTLGTTFRRFVTYSAENARAGQQRYWHHGVARLYLLAAPFVVLGAARRRAWWLVPLGGLAARSGRSLWRHRQGRGPAWALSPPRLALVALIVLAVDGATFLGWAQAALRRTRAPSPSGPQTAPRR